MYVHTQWQLCVCVWVNDFRVWVVKKKKHNSDEMKKKIANQSILFLIWCELILSWW